MELESLNNEYVALKKLLQNARANEQKLAKELQALEQDKALYESTMTVAKRDGNKSVYDAAKKNLETTTKEIARVKAEAEIEKQSVENFRTQITSKLEQVKNDPSLSLHLDKSLAVKYQRQANQLQKKRDEFDKKKNNVASLSLLLNNHQSLMNNARGIVAASSEISKSKQELESLKLTVPGGAYTYKDPARAAQLEQTIKDATAKLNTNKKAIKSYIKKHKISMPENAIDELEGLECKRVGKNQQLDVKSALDAKKKEYGREYDKTVRKLQKYQEAYKDLPEDAKQAANKGKIVTTPTPGPQTPEPTNVLGKAWNWLANTRFGKWFGRKWNGQEALPEAPKIEPRVESADFRDSLKYDIIRDSRGRQERDDLKRAGQNIDAQRQNNEHEDNDRD